MDTAIDRNPTIPSAALFPLKFPALSRAEHSNALKKAFAERARAFALCVGILFLPLLLQFPVTHLIWSDPKVGSLLVGALLFLKLVFSKDTSNPHFRRSGHFICIAFVLLIVLAVFPESETSSRSVTRCLLVSILIAGSLFQSVEWFLASVVVFGLLYARLVFAFHGGIEATQFWIELIGAAALSLVVQSTNAKFRKRYNLWAITDEVRLTTYSRAVEEARTFKSRFEKLSNAGKEALIFHTNGKIVDANRSALDMVGVELEQLLGKTIGEILGAGCSQLATQLVDPKRSSLSRVKVTRSDGTLLDAMAFNHLIMLPEESIAVLGLRPVDRKRSIELQSCLDPAVVFKN
jgi:PAS domain-containing protein